MNQDFIGELYKAHCCKAHLPGHTEVCHFVEDLLKVLFPELSDKSFHSKEEISVFCRALATRLEGLLTKIPEKLPETPASLAGKTMFELPEIRKRLMNDARAIAEGDPAAGSMAEVIRTYPGFYAVAIHRVSHEMHLLGIPLIPRILSEFAHAKTGIDIHPGATIGDRFCIDHGTGIVIGETAIIGDNVKIYQGVTLGALSVEKSLAGMKRHPTIEDNSVIYAGATILGGNTTVGNNSVIGGNVWLTRSVEPYTTVYHKPEIVAKTQPDSESGLDFII
ncbi:hypothetical protein FUAX_36500 [Fulvitalea axinellae]|uniref:Serine O-acetyltransferase n=1 Tax=Fulvitalea axinellae TaxID=1182444 RepID=A0AAU9CLZ0_9BACT|nr:hypothetical protein FUAX_36500 [Fulvitalea axinellae]